MALSDRNIKVLERIEGDTIVDVGCYTGLFVREASLRFPDKTVIGVDYFEDNIASPISCIPTCESVSGE